MDNFKIKISARIVYLPFAMNARTRTEIDLPRRTAEILDAVQRAYSLRQHNKTITRRGGRGGWKIGDGLGGNGKLQSAGSSLSEDETNALSRARARAQRRRKGRAPEMRAHEASQVDQSDLKTEGEKDRSTPLRADNVPMSYRDQQEDLSGMLIPKRETASS